MQTDTPVEVRIHDLARGGAGVGRLSTGEIIFVPFTAPGDLVRVRVVERKKSYVHGELIEVLEASPDRVVAPCSAFGRCGGCSWQHIPYPLQFETKVKGLHSALARAGVQNPSVPLDLLPAGETYHYRNRIQIRGNPSTREAGFYRPGSHSLVPVSECAIADPKINSALGKLLEEGFARFNEPFKLEISKKSDGGIRADWNERHAATGFQQINDRQNRLLQEWVKTHAGSGDLLLDLYGGNGNLSLPLIEDFKRIVCIDSGATEQEAPAPHFSFVRKSIQAWSGTDDANETAGPAVALLDPPREGIGELFPKLEARLSALGVSRVILVGCDVDAFARDTSRFISARYRLARLGALDLFPQTPHLESLALFLK